MKVKISIFNGLAPSENIYGFGIHFQAAIQEGGKLIRNEILQLRQILLIWSYQSTTQVILQDSELKYRQVGRRKT